MLTKIVEKYDGLNSYIINLVVGILNYISKGGSTNPTNIYDLGLNINFIQSHRTEIIVDLCFFILNLLYKSIVKSPSFHILKAFFFNHFNELIIIEASDYSLLSTVCGTDIIIDKVVFFLGLYAENLLLDSKEISSFIKVDFKDKFYYLLKYQFMALLNYSKNQGTSYQASFSIKNLLSIQLIKPSYQTFMIDFFPTFINAIEEIEVIPYFDLLESILNLNILSTDNIGLLTKKCIDRALREAKSTNVLKEKADDLSIYINKCLNILSDVSERFVFENVPAPNKISIDLYESLITEILSYIKNPSKCAFDLDIIEITTNLQKQSSKLLQSTQLVYQNLEKLCVKHSLNKSIFEFLNYLINNYPLNNHEECNKLLNIISKCIESADDVDFLFISLILQLIITVSILSIYI